MTEVDKRLPLATPKEVAAYRRTTEPSLAQERWKGTGPKFKKLGARVYYDWDDVYAWVDANTMSRTDDRPVGKEPP
ncbi:helix-turn-helix transcriptional regulator [Rhodococcus jostii]|uniref:helix-turn-helix transcriptional regulator n=1 Tax=Rhodococcus jostii TaxID=132919 RepID=UPI0036354059